MTSLFDVGVSVAVAPISLSGARSVTVPLSPKIVGHGDVAEHGAGDVMLVMHVGAQRIAGRAERGGAALSRQLVDHQITPATLPWRTTSPHESGGRNQRREPNQSNGSAHGVLCRQLLMMRGVMKISSSVFDSSTRSRLNSHLSTGTLPRPGVLSLDSVELLT